MNWITLESVTAGDWHRHLLTGLNWRWTPGESWLISGPNGSGKSALVALLVGRLEAVQGRFEKHPAFVQAEEAWVGFERQRLLLEWERHIDQSDVSESPDPGTLVRDFVGDEPLLEQFGLHGKGDRGLKHLSTGELRRACLARAWRLGLPFLLLDEPLEGLDTEGVALLKRLLERALTEGKDALFLTRRPADCPARIDLRWSLPAATPGPGSAPVRFARPPRGTGEAVLEFHSVRAGYRDLEVLSDFSWTVRGGDRWLVTGPNGSGKSTLLSLVSGDHPQVFSNDVRLFGHRRGPELTLDQVRRRVALVSYATHLRFRNLFGVTGLEVLASGFAGTIGLWDDPSWDQLEACRTLARDWGLEDAARQLWEGLSWGTQRLLLLGRALVSGAPLLLLDEPCQGLDAPAQERFLARVTLWANEPDHTLVYVTHRPDEVDRADFLALTLPQGRS